MPGHGRDWRIARTAVRWCFATTLLAGLCFALLSRQVCAQSGTASKAAPLTPILELPPLRPIENAPAVAPPLRTPKPPVVVRFSGCELTPAPTPPPPSTPLSAKAVPISLDAVMRLAQDQNGQVRLARERLNEAFAEQELANKAWLPELSVGVGYWRHEGGIQDFQGNLVSSSYGSVLAGLEVRGKLDLREAIFLRMDAERRVWQQQGELRKFSADQLLDAAATYVDLLAARSAEAIALDSEAQLQRLLAQARSLEKIDPGVRVETSRVEAELGNQLILTRRLREGAHAAVAKLIYLLGLEPTSELVVAEKNIAAIRLVNAEQSVDALVETALRRGPGVAELQAILGILEDMRTKSESPLHWLPSIEVKMGEGAFGATPDPRTNWDNRWDLGVQARWNLTELLTGRARRRVADTKIQQAYLGYHDLRAKLTLGVQEACEAASSNQEQLAFATKQIQHAEESYRLSDQRLRENIKGRSPSEVLLAIRSLVGARLSYLHAVRDLDKAQIRLFVLTGAAIPISACR